MPGYLDQYGAGDEQREKLRRYAVLSVLAVLVACLTLYLFLHNRAERAVVAEFAALLQKKDYTGAYRVWGPGKDYPFDKFQEDWGPRSKYADVPSYAIARTGACGTGVIVTVDLGHGRQEKLWVEQGAKTIGFSPWPQCPKRPFSERVLDKFKDWFGIGTGRS